ncbi:hypothetical protein D3C84_645880 [compost metagenome]
MLQITFAVRALQEALRQRKAGRLRFGADLAEHAQGATHKARHSLGQRVGSDDRIEIGVGRQPRCQLRDQLQQITFHIRCQRRIRPGEQFRFKEQPAIGQRLGQAFWRAELLHVRQAGEQLVHGDTQVAGRLIRGWQVLQQFQ